MSRLMQILDAHWVFTLATRDPADTNAPPHCAPLFYAVQAATENGAPALLFTSSPESVHSRHIGGGPREVGGAIYLETETVGELRGAQLRGVVHELASDSEAETAARARYLERHPVAEGVLAEGRHRLYRFVLTWAKLTDNRLGFGKHPVVDFSG